MNALKVLWNNSEKFSNIVIHLCDFPLHERGLCYHRKTYGFEDITFQAGICSSDSLNGVISGSHYNRNWTVHALFSEDLTTIDDSSIPDIIKGLLEDRKGNEEDLTNIEFDSRVLLFSRVIFTNV